MRVRIDLPQRGHADASRMLARLVLAQFTASVAVREDRSLFACLVLDDATGVVTPEAVRGIQRLRSGNAGVVLTLRTLDDVPRPLRGPLLGATGCRMALAGLTPWDGQDFAEVWGKEWIEARDVTDRQIIAETPAGEGAARGAPGHHRQGADRPGGDRTAGRAGAVVRVGARARGAAGARGAVPDQREGGARAAAAGGSAGMRG